MSKTVVSFFLTAVFLFLLAGPSVIAMVDDSVDVSSFYSIPEEEEKGKEKHNDIEILTFDLKNKDSDFMLGRGESDLTYYFKNHLQPHLNLVSPPPERL